MPTLSPLPNRSSADPGSSWMEDLLAAFPPPQTTANSPELNERHAARLALEASGLPGKHQEAWRFTDLSTLTRIPPRPMPAAPKQLPPSFLAPAPHIWRLHLDSWSPGSQLAWPEGIEPLEGADLNAHLGEVLAATGAAPLWTVQLTRAIAQGTLALRVRPGVKSCLELVTDSQERAGVQAHRLLVVLEEGASLDLLQVHHANGPSLTSVVLEARLNSKATLHHGLVAHGGASSALLTVTAVSQAPESHYTHASLCSGWGLARQEPVIHQGEGQAITHLRGLHWVRERQIADTHSRVRFEGPEGKLDQVHKVVAEGEARSVFNGCIQVPRKAQGTDASQLSRSLLLSERARVDTKPELEIVADDVRCRHGATISRLQPNELFYLQSRGIDAARAAQLLLRSFCQEVVGQLPEAAQEWNPLAPLLTERPKP